MRDKFLEKLLEFVKDILRNEFQTSAGRVNVIGMFFSLLLTLGLSLPALLETVVRLIRPNEVVGTPLLQLFIAFLVFVLICSAMLGYLEAPRRRQRGSGRTSKQAARSETEEPPARSHSG